jgi:predicted GIY-YIG superfamily endonuclease
LARERHSLGAVSLKLARQPHSLVLSRQIGRRRVAIASAPLLALADRYGSRLSHPWAMIPAMGTAPTSLYRLHDAQGGLLYIGIAGNPGRRFQEHAGTKPWWGQVSWVSIEHYETRTEAEAAETEAIQTERPKYNVAQVAEPLSGLPRISSVFTGLVYGNPHVWAIIACLAVTYGAILFTPGTEFARTHLRTQLGLSFLYPPVFAAAALVVALEIWQRSVEQKPTLPYWGVLVLLLGFTVPVGVWGDSPAFRRDTALGEVFTVGWLLLQQLVKAFALLALLRDLPWKERREPGSLRGRLRGLRGQPSPPP